MRCWRVPAAVGVLHLLVLAGLYFIWRRPSNQPARPAAIRASLVVQPASRPQPASAAQPPAAARSRPSPPASTRSPASESATAVRRRSQRRWRARTPEEIRRQAERRSQPVITTANRVDRADWQAVRRQLTRDLGSAAVASPAAAGGARLPQSYTDRLLALLYQVWRQPTRAQVADPKISVRIRLEIERSGALRRKGIIRASGNEAMDGSVRALLADLAAVPPLPDEVATVPLNLTVTLVLRR